MFEYIGPGFNSRQFHVMTTIKVSSANFYVGNPHPRQDARFLASFGCDVNGIQEGHSGNVEAIRAELRDTHRVFVKDSFGGIDVPIVVRKNVNVLSFKSREVSQRSQKLNIGMPRNAGILRFRKGGEDFCIINTHLNAAVQGPEGRPLSQKIKRVAEYVDSIQILERVIKNAKGRGEHVVLVGDLNYRFDRDGVGWRYSPQSLFKRCGMKWEDERLDYIAWTGRLHVKRMQTIGPDKTGSDHPWLIGTFDTGRA